MDSQYLTVKRKQQPNGLEITAVNVDGTVAATVELEPWAAVGGRIYEEWEKVADSGGVAPGDWAIK